MGVDGVDDVVGGETKMIVSSRFGSSADLATFGSGERDFDDEDLLLLSIEPDIPICQEFLLYYQIFRWFAETVRL